MIETLSRDATVVASVPIAAYTAAAAVNGAALAWGKYRSVMVVIFAGTITDGTHTFEVQDSDDNSSFTAVADAYLHGTEPALVDSSSDSVTVIGYKGTRKYIRTVVTTAGATSGGIVGSLIIASNSSRKPS